MPFINIDIKNKVAVCDPEQFIVGGNADYVVDFRFDEEWEAFDAKVARFIWSNGFEDVTFSGSECPIPIIANTNSVLVGVYVNDTLRTTTRAVVRVKKSILCDNIPEGGTIIVKGDNGKSAYEIAVENGFEGTEQEWLNIIAHPNKPTLDKLTEQDGKLMFNGSEISEKDLFFGKNYGYGETRAVTADESFKLKEGVVLYVWFACSGDDCRAINVNDTGDVYITSRNNANECYEIQWDDCEIVCFIYSAGCWVYLNHPLASGQKFGTVGLSDSVDSSMDKSRHFAATPKAVGDVWRLTKSIEMKVPAQATIENKLADKEFVNSSIATNTASFKGTFESVSDLPTSDVDNNDYGFVISTDEAGNTVYNRYKFDGTEWAFEFALNNSSFTAEQWATISSGITSGMVENFNTHIDKLVTTVSAESTDEQYPSAKAVYDLIGDVSGAIESINAIIGGAAE